MVKNFLTRQLATAGWAPVDYPMAAFLCPDVANAHRDFSSMKNSPEMLPKLFKATVYRARVADYGDVLLLARSPQFLAERLGWLGFIATDVEAVRFSTDKPAAQPVVADGDKEKERIERLRAEAAEELPAHDCRRRKEILAARAELESIEQ